MISVKGDAAKKVSYGELVGGQPFGVALNPAAKRKHPREWKILGTPVPRVEIPAIVAGQFEYVHNVRVPGMLHGRVVRPPAVGATVSTVDESSVSGMPGMVKVVVKKNFVGVVAEKPWQAIQAAAKLKISWTNGAGLPSHRDFHDHLRHQQPTRDTFLVNSKDVDEKLASTAKVVKATYLYPFQMHGSIGTACAVADVQGGAATIWSATQAVYPLKSSADAARSPAGNVRRLQDGSRLLRVQRRDPLLRRGADVSGRRQTGARAADAQGRNGLGKLRVAFVIDGVSLTADGTIAARDCESWCRPGGRPGGNTRERVTGYLAGFRAPFTRVRRRPIRRRSRTTATPCRRMSPAACRGAAAAPGRSPASAS